jgi:hypothetical protein
MDKFIEFLLLNAMFHASWLKCPKCCTPAAFVGDKKLDLDSLSCANSGVPLSMTPSFTIRSP